jgi:hypothetical protein
VVAVTADGASVMVSLIEDILKLPRVHCACHLHALEVEGALHHHCIKALMDRVSYIVAYFHKSVNREYARRNEYSKLGFETAWQILSACATR